MTLKRKKLNNIDIYVSSDFDGYRLDQFLHKIFPEYSRSFFQNLIKQDFIKINDKSTKSGYKLKTGEHITGEIVIDDYEFDAENIPIDVLYEDDYIIAINKPAGMVVHPAPGHYNGTLVNALLYHFNSNLSDGFSSDRPGVIHRLDKDTSGVILITKTQEAQLKFSNLFKERKINKIYRALVWGRLNVKDKKIDFPIGRHKKDRKKFQINGISPKNAVSIVNTIKELDLFSYLEIKILTGRTHQIRLHLSYINHPIIGDLLYGNDKNFLNVLKNRNSNLYKIFSSVNRQLLHAYKISFLHPFFQKEIEITSPIPEDFENCLKYIFNYL